MKRILVSIDSRTLKELETFMDKVHSKTYAGAIKKLMILGFKRYYNPRDFEIDQKLDCILNEIKSLKYKKPKNNTYLNKFLHKEG